MSFNKERISSILLIALTIISSASLYTYGNSTLNQITILTQLVILVGMACLNSIFSDKYILLILFLNTSSLIVTMAFHKSFGVTIVFANLLVACFIFNNIQIKKNTFISMHLIVAILWSILVFCAVRGDYMNDAGDYFHYRSLGTLYHKNTIGIAALGSLYHWGCLIHSIPVRELTRNIISLPVFMVFILKIIETDCRSAILAVLAFAVLYCLVRREIPYIYYYTIVILCIVCSGIFTIYYVNNVVELDVGDVMGRNPFERLGVWKAAHTLIKEYPIFGSGTDYKMMTFDSAHSTVLSILKTIGIIPAISYALSLVMRCRNIIKKKYLRISQIAIISGLMVSVFESFYVESYLYLPFLLLLITPYQGKNIESIGECKKDIGA